MSAGTVALLFGGLLGSWCRARFSGTQETWSTKTLTDMLIGGAFSTAIPHMSWVSGFVQWDTVPIGVQFFLAFGLSLTTTWAITAYQWAARMQGKEPSIKNAAPLLRPAASREENAKHDASLKKEDE